MVWSTRLWFCFIPLEGIPFVESQRQQDIILSISTLLAFPVLVLRSTIMNNHSFKIILFKIFIWKANFLTQLHVLFHQKEE